MTTKETLQASEDAISLALFKSVRKNDFLCFCKYYLPHLFPLPFAESVHPLWAKDIEAARFESMTRGENAPRELAKTTFYAIAAPIYWLAHNRNEKIKITQATGKAEECVRQIMWEFETNERLIADFGRFKPADNRLKWSFSEGGIVAGAIDKKNMSVSACGVRGASIGSRTTKLIVDDIHDPDNVASEYQRDKTIQWVMGGLMPTVVSDGSTFFINSSYHEDDLLNRYKKKKITFSYTDKDGNTINKDFKIRTWDWIVKDKDGNDTMQTVWPERHDYNSLMRRKEEISNDVIFNMQYRNIVQSEDTASFKMTDLELMRDYALSYYPCRDYSDGKPASAVMPFNIDRAAFKFIIQSWDLAVVDDARRAMESDSDYYVCHTVGVRHDNRRQLLQTYRKRGIPAPEVLLMVEGQYNAFLPDLIIIESNQFQNWLADYSMRFMGLPIVKNVTVAKDKGALGLKSSALHVAISSKWWIFPYMSQEDQIITERIFRELFYFGKERHDDLVMAMYFIEKHIGNVSRVIAEAIEKNGNEQTYNTHVADIPDGVDIGQDYENEEVFL
jgi:phage terminase large subunit-like protein